MRRLIFVGALMILAIAGCGKKAMVRYDQPELPPDGYWETAWVDPEIILSQDWFSLIRASRVDSFLVERQSKLFEKVAPSLVFEVPSEGCFTIINLVSSNSTIIRPIVARNLYPGHYKATVDLSRLSLGRPPADGWYLKAEFCDQSVIQRVVFQ